MCKFSSDVQRREALGFLDKFQNRVAAPEDIVKFALLSQQATSALAARGTEAVTDEVPRSTASVSRADNVGGAVESTTLLDT